MESPTLDRLLGRLRALREHHGLTQEEFAEIAGMSYKHYQAIEAGRKPDMRLSTLDRLASTYGIEVAELLGKPYPKTEISSRR